MEARPVAAAALAVLLLVALVVHEGQSNSGGVVLSQRGTLDPKVHQALLSLARHLEGELQGVEGVLSAVDASASSPSARGQALAASSTPTSQSAVPGDSGKQSEEEAKWAKKTMQQGVLRKESVADQLKHVLAKKLKEKLLNQTHWNSVDELEKAQELGDYLTSHPLPKYAYQHLEASRAKQTRLEHAAAQVHAEDKKRAKARLDADDNERQLAKAAAVEHSSSVAEQSQAVAGSGRMTQADYRALENDLARVGAAVEADRKASAARGHHSAEMQRAAAHTRLGGFFDPAVVHVKLGREVQPGDAAMMQAASAGRGWAERENLREHGEFTRLPGPGAGFPLAIRPYWDDALRQ